MLFSGAPGALPSMSRGAGGKAVWAVVWEGERATENYFKIVNS